MIAPEKSYGVQATYCLFILVSVLSLVIGYYDIIKNVPLFRKVGSVIHICYQICSTQIVTTS